MSRYITKLTEYDDETLTSTTPATRTAQLSAWARMPGCLAADDADAVARSLTVDQR